MLYSMLHEYDVLVIIMIYLCIYSQGLSGNFQIH